MIDKASVKIYNDYSNIIDRDPTTDDKTPEWNKGDTWLNTVSGDSFELKDAVAGTWNRIELKQDYFIERRIQPSIMKVLRYVGGALRHNYYVANKDTTSGSSNQVSTSKLDKYRTGRHLINYISTYGSFEFGLDKTIKNVGGFADRIKEGDLIEILDTDHNDNVNYVVSKTTDNELVMKYDLSSETSYGLLSYLYLPPVIEDGISSMIWYDVFTKDISQIGFKSEKLDYYSYTKYDNNTGAGSSLGYPDELVDFLPTPNIKVY